VTDLREFIKNRDSKKEQPDTSTSTSGGASSSGGDAIVDKEKREAAEREARGTRARVMGNERRGSTPL
jgi:hypothetical protein